MSILPGSGLKRNGYVLTLILSPGWETAKVEPQVRRAAGEQGTATAPALSWDFYVKGK